MGINVPLKFKTTTKLGEPEAAVLGSPRAGGTQGLRGRASAAVSGWNHGLCACVREASLTLSLETQTPGNQKLTRFCPVGSSLTILQAQDLPRLIKYDIHPI